MAEVNTIQLSEVENFKDLSPEFYKADYMRKSLLIRNQNYRRLSQISYITDGEHGSPCWSNNSGIKYITAEFIKENFIDNGDFKQITLEQDRKNARARLQENDLLIYSVGAYAGLTCVAEPHLFPANIPRSVAIVRLHNLNEFYPEFISVFLNSKFGKFQSLRFRAGNSQPVLALEKIRQFEVPLIDPNIQLEIKNLYQQSYELRKQSQTLYQQATDLLEQELGLDNSDLDNSPNKYISNFDDVVLGKRLDPEYYNPRTRKIVERIRNLEHTVIAKHFSVKNGFPWNSKKFLDNNSGEPVIRIRDIKPTYIDKQNLTSIKPEYAATISFPTAKVGDVVIGMDGLKYFYASILEDDCLVNQRVCHLEAKESSGLSSEYITFIINSSIGQAQLLRDMTIATTVGHITNLNIARLIIPIVSIEFHDTISDLVRKSIDAKKESKRLLEQAKNRVEQLIEAAAGE